MKNIQSLILLSAISLTVIFSSAAQAEYFAINIGKNASIFYEETSYPYWVESTYNARFSAGLVTDQKGGPSVYFYSGVPYHASEKATTVNSYIWSFWGVDHPLTPGDAVKPIWWRGDFHSPLSVGEGASGKIEGKVTMTAKTWYPGLLRIWRPIGDKPANVAYIGQWFKDGVTGDWSHLATMKVPFAATHFDGAGGFIEDFSHGNRKPRRVNFRRLYYYENGAWSAAKKFSPSTRQKTEKGTSGLMDGGSAAFFETCSGPNYKGNMGPGHDVKTWTLNTPDKPSFDPFMVNGIQAISAGGQVLVTWAIPPKSAPQFSYEIKVFATQNTAMTPMATLEVRDPDARMQLVDVPGLKAGATPFVQVTFTDIFNRAAKPLMVRAPLPSKVTPASAAINVRPGLDYQTYQTTGAGWKTLPDFSKLQATGSGAVDNLDLTVCGQNQNFAARFTGRIQIPVGGLWEFWLHSCDGSRLLIDGKTVIDFDGVHSRGEDKTGAAALPAGMHHVEVQYFKGESQKDNAPLLKLSWAGPKMARSPIPASVWFRNPAANIPSLLMTAPANGQTVSDANAQLSVSGTASTSGTVGYYIGNTLWAESSQPPYSTKTLLGDGVINLKARFFYGHNQSVDSPVIRVKVVNQEMKPWKFSAVGKRAFPAAASFANSELSFVGDGFNFAWQEINGDATIIANIADHPSTSKGSQRDGSKFSGDWKGGVIFRKTLDANVGNPLGGKFVAFYGELNNSIRLQSNQDHNGGGPVSGPDLRNGKMQWIKLTRKGDTFTASLSADGKTWTQVGTRTGDLPQHLYVGLFTLVRPSANPNPLWWKFSNVSLTK